MRAVQSQPEWLSRRKPKEKAIWHCTYLCLRELLLPGQVPVPATGAGHTRDLSPGPWCCRLHWLLCLFAAGHPACPGLCWLSIEGLEVELSLGYSLVWHILPELVVKLLLSCSQHQQLLYFNRDAQAGLRNPELCYTCFTCSASLTALPWPR